MADYIQLSKTAEIFTFDGSGAASPAGQSITVSAAISSGTPTWTATRYNSDGISLGPVALAGEGSSRTLAIDAFADAAYCVVTVNVVIGGTPYTGTEYLTRYQSGDSTNIGKQPDAYPDYWTDQGPTNRWAMFDFQSATQTMVTGSLVVVGDVGAITSLVALNVDGTSITASVTNGPSGGVIYSSTQSLSGPTDSVSFTGIPANAASRLTITIAGTVSKCGRLIGSSSTTELGPLLANPEISIIDYSRVGTDEFGTKTFVKRAFSTRISGQVLVMNDQVQSVFTAVANLRATPCLWQMATNPQIASILTVFGYYRSFTVAIPYSNHSLVSFEIESLT